MRYHYQSGESGAALKDYQACLQALKEQLDVGPAPETVALSESIAKHELSHGEEARDPLRVAVLPISNFGPDPNDEYFADGMTEELIAQLSKIDGLQVIARTSSMQYKGTHKGITQIGRELRVGTILEGSVRKSDSRLRIAVQLINVNDEAHLWSDEYDRELKDAVAIQCDVASQVASSLLGRLLPNVARALDKEKDRDPVAHTLYLKGRFFWNKWTKDGYAKAIEYYKQALAIDKDYALAYAGLADAYNMMAAEGIMQADGAYTTAKGYAARAIEIDDTLAEAHASLAFIAWKHERDLDRAEHRFKRAIMLDPNCPTVHTWYAQFLVMVGKTPEALEQSQEALALDPLSANLTFQVGMALRSLRRLDEAIEAFYKTLELNPVFTSARLRLSVTLRANREWKRGVAEARRAVELEPENPYAHQFLSMALIAFGRRDEGLVQLDEALRLCRGCETTSVLFNAGVGCYFAAEYDRSITYLGQASERDTARTEVYVMLAAAHIEKGEYEDALKALEKAESVFGGVDDFWSVWIPARRGQVYALQGNTKEAEEELKVLLRKTELRNRRVAVSVLLSALGRMDEAFEWANRAIDANEPHTLPMKCSPMWAKCGSDKRYHALLRKIGLEE
jgi:TolB-like protein/Tfp pilus assembly protein PilF